MHFATLESILVLATVCQRVRLDVEPGQRLEFSPSVTLRPKHTIRMRVVERTPERGRQPNESVSPSPVRDL